MRAPVSRVAAIHDLSGVGHTSLTVVIPVLATMGIEACPLPTAVLSTQTGGFDDFCFVDLSSPMRDFLEHWKKLGLRFDAVYSGFLGSPAQTETVADCIDACLLPGGLAVVDPVLGDQGELDATMTPEMVERLRWLVSKADCITPNITEAAFLLSEPMPLAVLEPDKAFMDEEEIKDWLLRLTEMGPACAVITSAPVKGRFKNSGAVIAYDREQKRFWKVESEYLPTYYPGTGDTFTSVLTGSLVLGESLPVAMDRAVQFVSMGIRASFGHNLPHREGILLEKVLSTLRSPMLNSTYELI